MYERPDSLSKLSWVQLPQHVKPPLQDLSALNFDICGFTGVIFVVLNTKFELVSFKLIIAVFVKHFISRFQVSNVNLHT